ncbi:MAG TPA: TIGR03435 family protein [Acidobacteriaceae bacterium]|nr:TIGR03435 family protein [Acidobacteriaceae bacterium]
MPAWQQAAGGKMEFEVVSVRLGKPDDRSGTRGFPLSADDSFQPTGGLFRAEFRLQAYITFAYKLWMTREQEDAMLAPLPSWARNDKFVIEARAAATATKDQYRLMMQSVLAERFGLKLHFEPKESAVLLMTVETPGKLGPRLRPHSEGPACDAAPAKDIFPAECSSYEAEGRDGMFLVGSRDTTMPLLADLLGMTGGMMDEIGRPVIDDTGLKGSFDFTLQIAPPARNPGKDSAAAETQGPTFLQAVREQLGLRLKPGKAILSLPVIDHVERPSEN